MANTYTAIATTTVGSGGASTISFTSIPGTYTDLVLALSLRQSGSGGSNVAMTFNSSTTSYTNIDLIVANTSITSESTVLGTSSIKIGFITSPDYTSSTFANTQVYIPNYAGSNYKTVSTEQVMENNASTVYFGLFAGLWSNTSGITSITLTPQTGNFIQYSTATLYGISKS